MYMMAFVSQWRLMSVRIKVFFTQYIVWFAPLLLPHRLVIPYKTFPQLIPFHYSQTVTTPIAVNVAVVELLRFDCCLCHQSDFASSTIFAMRDFPAISVHFAWFAKLLSHFITVRRGCVISDLPVCIIKVCIHYNLSTHIHIWTTTYNTIHTINIHDIIYIILRVLYNSCLLIYILILKM